MQKQINAAASSYLACTASRIEFHYLEGGWVGVATNLAHLQPRVTMHSHFRLLYEYTSPSRAGTWSAVLRQELITVAIASSTDRKYIFLSMLVLVKRCGHVGTSLFLWFILCSMLKFLTYYAQYYAHVKDLCLKFDCFIRVYLTL